MDDGPSVEEEVTVLGAGPSGVEEEAAVFEDGSETTLFAAGLDVVNAPAASVGGLTTGVDSDGLEPQDHGFNQDEPAAVDVVSVTAAVSSVSGANSGVFEETTGSDGGAGGEGVGVES